MPCLTTAMKPSKLNIASISDIHLGNRLVPARDMTEKLDKAFPNNHSLDELDIIFIGGDVFDRLLHLNEEAAIESRKWIARFLRRCKRYDVMVRIVEGTPSHDWGQSHLFISINEIADIGCDVKYHKELCIEHIERFGIDVLYVPDEWEFETQLTWKQVKELLAEKGLEKVDFAIMHGAFEYQYPASYNAPTHSEENYLSIVRYYIFIGHVHRHLPKGRIIPNGSFDRLRQNEEEDKGHVRATIRKKGDHSLVFIPNEDAHRFVTIDCTALEVNEALDKIEKVCRDLPDNSYVRIKANKEDPIVNGLDTMTQRYPLINWDTKFSTKEAKKAETLTDLRSKFKGVEISRDNIVELMMERIRNRTDDMDLINRCRKHLEEVV